MTSRRFDQLFNQPPRKSESELTQFHMDLAASIQQVTEDIVLLLATPMQKETGCETLCLAGGVALNCVANGHLQREGPFQNIWIQPASGDAGSALGAHWWPGINTSNSHASPNQATACRAPIWVPTSATKPSPATSTASRLPSERLTIQPYLLNLPHCWIKARWWAGSTDAWNSGLAPWGRSILGTLAIARCKPR